MTSFRGSSRECIVVMALMFPLQHWVLGSLFVCWTQLFILFFRGRCFWFVYGESGMIRTTHNSSVFAPLTSYLISHIASRVAWFAEVLFEDFGI